MDRLDLHDRREPAGRDSPLDGKDLAGPVLVGALPNQKDGVQDGNKSVLVAGE